MNASRCMAPLTCCWMQACFFLFGLHKGSLICQSNVSCFIRQSTTLNMTSFIIGLVPASMHLLKDAWVNDISANLKMEVALQAAAVHVLAPLVELQGQPALNLQLVSLRRLQMQLELQWQHKQHLLVLSSFLHGVDVKQEAKLQTLQAMEMHELWQML